MSVLVVGISHRSAPVEVLERLALDADGVRKLLTDVAASDHVTEAAVLATCNRLEIYTDVDRFHGSVEDISRLLCQRSGRVGDDLIPHLYVHYDDGAVSHLFQVAAGLDSMVVGEGQILGQTREALRLGQEHATIGPALNVLFQQALRVGKRAHAETDIDRAAPSLVTAALDRSVVEIGPITGLRAVVVGAGTMAALATATLARLGASDIAVVNRTAGNAKRLAGEHAARSVSLDSLTAELGRADVVICCTGATGVVLGLDQVVAARAGTDKPLAVVDLALPHDVEPEVGDLPGVTLIGLRRLADELSNHQASREVDGVREIVDEEIQVFSLARRQASVTPTLVALRSMATGVVEAEIERLLTRLPDLDDAGPRRGRDGRTTGRRQAAPPAHDPGQGAGQRDRRDLLREGPGRAVRPGPRRRRRRDQTGRSRMTIPTRPQRLRLGTRASLLARTQSQTVADLIHARMGVDVDLVEVSTKGDADHHATGAAGRRRRLRRRTARRAPAWRGRRLRPLAQGPAHGCRGGDRPGRRTPSGGCPRRRRRPRRAHAR